MSKKFIVIVDEDFDAKIKNEITAYFQQKEANIWHWISNVWLVVDKQNKLERKEIRKALTNISRTGTILVFETSDPNLCSGLASPTQSKWIMENWVNEEPKF